VTEAFANRGRIGQPPRTHCEGAEMTVTPLSPSPRNPIAVWFQVGGAIFAGFGCLSLMGAIVVIVGVNAFMPSDTPPAGYDTTGQDAYAVVTAPFRAFRWLINEVSPVLVIVGFAPLLLGILFMVVSRGLARDRSWARIAGAGLLLVPVLFGGLAMMGAIIEDHYDEAAYMLPLLLVPLYPFWLLVWKWKARTPRVEPPPGV
jgi:hypothetical protein